MSIEKKKVDQAKRTDLSISSVNSSLTDEALENEEKYRKTKKKLDMIKKAYIKLKEDHEELKKQNHNVSSYGKSNENGNGMGGRVASKDDLAMIKEAAEKDAFRKTEKVIIDLRKRNEDLDTENKLISSQLKQACNESLASTKENLNLREEMSELRRETERINNEKESFKLRLKEVEAIVSTLSKNLIDVESERSRLQVEATSLKNKVIEGEYSAFCYTIREVGLSGNLEELQLILRKNCLGEPVFEFENKNGDIRVLRAALISDIESDPNDIFKFRIKYKQYGCFGVKTIENYSCDNRGRLIWNIKNFLVRNKKEVEESANQASNSVNRYQRNIVDDLRRLFFA